MKHWKGLNKVNWLCLMMSQFVGSNSLKGAPFVLSGYRSVTLSGPLCKHELAIMNLRKICLSFNTIAAIRKAVIQYNDVDLSSNVRRLYTIDERTLTFEPAFDHDTHELKEALDYIQKPIDNLDHKSILPDPVSSKIFLEVEKDSRNFVFELTGINSVENNFTHDFRSPNESPLKIPIEDLHQIAASMDNIDRSNGYRAGNWEQRLRNIIFEVPKDSGRFDPVTSIELDSLKHLIGLPGAGKTTLLICLTKWLSDNHLRTVLFFTSVDICRQYMATLKKYGVQAGLLMGQSKKARKHHAHRIGETIASGDPMNGFASTTDCAEYFSTSCPLPAFTNLNENAFNIEGANCDNVRYIEIEDLETENERSEIPKKCLCPLWSKCEYQKAARELTTTDVWLGHVASTDTVVPEHTVKKSLRYLELIAKRSDVVIFDEADKVQSFLDQQGIAMLALAGVKDSFSASLSNHHLDVSSGENNLLGDPQLFSFQMQAIQFNRFTYYLVNALHYLDNNQFSRLEGAFLTPSRLISELVTAGNGVRNRSKSQKDTLFRKKDALSQLWDSAVFEAFDSSSDYNAKNFINSAESVANNLSISTKSVLDCHQDLTRLFREWLNSNQVSQLNDLSEELLKILGPFLPNKDIDTQQLQRLKVLTALSFTIVGFQQLEPHTHTLSERGYIEPLKLDQRCSDKFLSYTSSNILGGLSGVRYFSSSKDMFSKNRKIRLQHVRFAGSPRAFMYNLHRLFGEDTQGPKVLLTSATSFLKFSPAFHITKGPDYLVRGASAASRFEQSSFEFMPLRDKASEKKFLRFSGVQGENQKTNNLKSMVYQLINEGHVSRAIKEFDAATRQRKAAFVVNSFDQAEQIKEYIDRKFPHWKSKSVALTRDIEKHDGDQGYITSSQIELVGDVDSIELLIFPMAAIGRGVNIVFSSGARVRDAAIGTLYFLTRPHPSVDDLSLLVSIAASKSEEFGQRDYSDITSLTQISKDYATSRRHTYATVAKLLRSPLMASRLGDLHRPFTANLAVELLQTIGRAMRNGCPVQCYFIDAAWAQASCNGEKDTPVSSMLVQLIEILGLCINDPDPKSAAIYQELYGAFYEPLKNTKNLHFGDVHHYNDPTTNESYYGPELNSEQG